MWGPRGKYVVHMKRSWNFSIWIGLLLVALGLLTYIPIFSLYPVTRDFPWVNLLMMAGGFAFLGRGLVRAWKEPAAYRGKVFGSVFALLSIAGIGLFCYGLFYLGRNLPPAAGAPRVGQKAPDFSLPDQDGKTVVLSDLLQSRAKGGPGGRPSAVLLIFYRGHW